MRFSIIIPTYNREQIVPKAIRSILEQEFTDLEIIVVDDGSQDGTALCITKLNNEKIRYVKTENHGVAHARNTGMRIATGDYVGFLDSDDLYEKDHLKVANELIRQHNEPSAIHLNFRWGPEDRKLSNKNVLPQTMPDDLFQSCSLHVNCLFLKKNVAKELFFNEDRELIFAEDWDYFMKLAVRYKIVLKDHISAYLIDHVDRSMRNFDEEKWVKRKEALSRSLNEDPVISSHYKDRIIRVSAHMNTLIAVNLAVRTEKRKVFRYLWSAMREQPAELLSKRGMAILKHLLFTW